MGVPLGVVGNDSVIGAPRDGSDTLRVKLGTTFRYAGVRDGRPIVRFSEAPGCSLRAGAHCAVARKGKSSSSVGPKVESPLACARSARRCWFSALRRASSISLSSEGSASEMESWVDRDGEGLGVGAGAARMRDARRSSCPSRENGSGNAQG